jgi:hypothetical protein
LWVCLLSAWACGCSERESKKSVERPPKVESSAVSGLTGPAGPASDETRAGAEKAGSWLNKGQDDRDRTPLVQPDQTLVRPQGDSDKLAAGAVRPREKGRVKPPARGCAVVYEQPTRVWPAPGPVALAAVGDRFVAAGYWRDDKEERVYVVRVSPGSLPQPLTTLRLKTPHPGERAQRPGMAARDISAVTLAITDGSGEVLVGAVPVDRPSAAAALRRIGSEADTRFSPAVSHVAGLAAVAFSVGTTPMRTMLALLDAGGRVRAFHDVTPQAMGATAPVFVDGLTPPVLLVLDAHQGYSPLLRVALSPDGTPAKAEVVVPLKMIAGGVQLAAARGANGTFVAYTAIGNAATSAVGLLPISPKPGQVQALVPGTGYGPLHVAAVSAPGATVFAADAPIGKGGKEEREVQVRIVDANGLGPVTVVRGPEGTAFGATLARGKNGTVAVGFSDGEAVWVQFLRCDDG